MTTFPSTKKRKKNKNGRENEDEEHEIAVERGRKKDNILQVGGKEEMTMVLARIFKITLSIGSIWLPTFLRYFIIRFILHLDTLTHSLFLSVVICS